MSDRYASYIFFIFLRPSRLCCSCSKAPMGLIAVRHEQEERNVGTTHPQAPPKS